MCKKGIFSGGDSEDEEEDEYAHMDGAGKIDEDDDMDPNLIKNSRLPEIFADIDEDGSGQIEFKEFLAGFGLDNSPLTQKIFYIFDEDHSGAVDYYEFLKALDKYRKMTYDQRMEWCFKVYDLDDSGYIDRDELTAIVMDVNFAIRSYKTAKGMIGKLNRYYEIKFEQRLEQVDVKQFKALAAAHGTLLIYPAMAVMERVMGIAFTDPDNHLSWWDTFRPGQGGVLLAQRKKAEDADGDMSLG